MHGGLSVFKDRLREDTRDEAHRKLVTRSNDLIKDCVRAPFQGIGKPEPLRGPLSGWWSRRITQVHRLVYRATEDGLLIAQYRLHY